VAVNTLDYSYFSNPPMTLSALHYQHFVLRPIRK